MGISDEKIKAALSKLENQKKNSFVEAVLKDLEAVNKVHDPILMLKKISDMQQVFATLEKKNKDSSLEVYREIMASLSNAISEHVQILTEHAKESLSNIK
jgi:hypothetical protein